MSGPIEVKVSAATIASAVSGLGLWALQTYVFRTDVPLPVIAAVQVVVPAIVTFAAGYMAPHTPRPDLLAENCDELDQATIADAKVHDHALDGDPDEVPARHYMTEQEIDDRQRRKP